MRRFVLTTFTAFCFCGSAFAADFLPISGVTSSTGETDLWPASNLIQGPGEGFDANEPHEKLASDAAGNWVTADPGGFPSDYIEAAGAPVLTFDLGADVLVSDVSVWGYSSGNGNGTYEFTLNFATDAEGAGGGASSSGPFYMAGDINTGQNDSTSRQVFDFEDVTARYVELVSTDNFFVAPGDGSAGEDVLAGGDRVGLGEVAFSTIVPEPAGISMILFGLVAAAARRRRR